MKKQSPAMWMPSGRPRSLATGTITARDRAGRSACAIGRPHGEEADLLVVARWSPGRGAGPAATGHSTTSKPETKRRSALRIAAQRRTSNEELRAQRQRDEVVQQVDHLRHVPSVRGDEVGASLCPAVRGHHREGEVDRVVERRRLGLLHAGAERGERRACPLDRLAGAGRRGRWPSDV